MKKNALLVLMLSVILVLTACGSSSGNGSNAGNDSNNGAAQEGNAGGDSGKVVEIEFWHALSGHNGDVTEELVKKFNETHPNIKVKSSFQGSYFENHSKILAAVAAGNQPDAAMIEIASVDAFADARVIEDLGPYANGTESKYIQGLLGNSYKEGKLIAIPFNRSIPLLYLNTDMLEANNLDPAGPKTWDELESFAAAMTKKDGDKSIFGFETPIDIWFYEALVLQSGGNVLTEDGKQLNLDNEAGKAPLEFWNKMLKAGIMKSPPGEKYNAWDVATQDFMNGNVGMIFTSSGDMKKLLEGSPFNVGAAFLPKNEEYAVPTGGTNLAILAKSSEEKKKAAWEFISWMTDTEQTVYLSKNTGYLPVTNDALTSADMEAVYAETPIFKVAADQLQYAKPRPAVPGYKELQEIIMTEIQKVTLGMATADEAIKTATTKAERLLK